MGPLVKSEHQLRAEIQAATKDLDTAKPGTPERVKALQRLTALRREIGMLELKELKEKNK